MQEIWLAASYNPVNSCDMALVCPAAGSWKSCRVSGFYFLLYFCAFEIAPVLVVLPLSAAAQDWISKPVKMAQQSADLKPVKTILVSQPQPENPKNPYADIEASSRSRFRIKMCLPINQYFAIIGPLIISFTVYQNA